ncbi:MAG: class I SAM-dependent methyltransferase [Aggregatilineales bacterium]|nr:class I SAM-dependent methyltransferase [Chloroflexota bacterium]HQE19692.1 class I SAM-dependent methyltransferase [Aggregatilineales bacterium]
MTSVHHQEQFYNNRWQDFDFANRLKLARCINILNGLLGTKKVAPRIIDLGCGAGWLTSILGQFGPTVGVELSRRAVEEAARKFPHVTFIQADIFTWDYPKEEFDIVVSQEVIEHVDEQERYLAIAHDLLQPDGYLILTTPNARTFYAMQQEQRESWSRQPIENWISRRELANMVKRYFEILELKTIILGYGSRGSYRLVNSRRVRDILHRVGLASAYDSLREHFGYGLHIMLVAQKRNRH